MNATIRPLADINKEAEKILIREMGIAATLRFMNQFRVRSGDYTKERGHRLDELSLDEITSEIKARRRKPRRVSR